MNHHSAASIFPLLDGAPLRELAADIAEHGLREPIVLLDGAVLDGRNRLAACEAVGVEPSFVDYAGDDPIAFVVSLNLRRRHLSESQRAMVATRIATLRDGMRSDRVGRPIGRPTPMTQTAAGELLSVGARSVRRARVVIERGVPALSAAVDAGVVPVSTAAEVSLLPVEKQEEVLARVQDGERPRAAVAAVSRPHVANNSGENEWYTPPRILDAVRACMGRIDLDPASSDVANRTVQATCYYTLADDGLAQSWSGNVFLNPPYSTGLVGRFAEAAASKYEGREFECACVLVNNATETAWFQRILGAASALCLLASRVRFHDSTGVPRHTPLQGQVVLYLGADTTAFVRAFRGLGRVCLVVPDPPTSPSAG